MVVATEYGNVDIKKASQENPYRLYKKVFKSKKHKDMIEELKDIVRKYYPNYGDKDISIMYDSLSKSGCTYATMANVIMEQLGNDNNTFYDYFGYSLSDKAGKVILDKLMVDIYACISRMVEVEVYKYDICKFRNVFEASRELLGKEYNNSSLASVDLFNAGWRSDGVDEKGMLIFKNRFCTKETLMGTYSDIAYSLFDVKDVNMNKENLEMLFKQNNMEYKFSFLDVYSKFSGLPVLRLNNLVKWMDKYFDKNNINLALEASIIDSSSVSYEEFLKNIHNKMDDGYSIDVSSPLKADVWMSDGKEWVKPTEGNAGHQMNFLGFDKEGNILVCSWGKTYMFPKEFYKELEFMAIKVVGKDREVKKSM